MAQQSEVVLSILAKCFDFEVRWEDNSLLIVNAIVNLSWKLWQLKVLFFSRSVALIDGKVRKTHFEVS